MTLTLFLTALGALLSGLAPSGDATDIYATIVAARFILGVGAGGVYPLSATKAAEDGGDKAHVDPVAAGIAFCWQAPGALSPWVVGYGLTYSTESTGFKWRLLLWLGAIPATLIMLLTIYEMHLTERKKEAERNFAAVHNAVLGGQQSMSDRVSRLSRASVESHKLATDSMMVDPKYRTLLRVTGGTWFIYDVAYYGVALFGGDIINSMKSEDDDNVSTDASLRYAYGKEMIALAVGIPASIMTVLLITKYGLKRVQVYGFLFQALMFFLMAATFYPLKNQYPNLLFAIYCMLLFSLNAGPSMTTYCLPSKTFPYEIRSTFNGISAACGKLGAAVGAFMVRASHCSLALSVCRD